MKTKIDFLRILRIGFLAFCVAVVAAPSLVRAQGEIGLSGLKLGMTMDQALSSLAARGIHPVKKPITGAMFKGERLEFYLSDSTIAEPVLVQLAFTERDAMKLYGINFEASEKSGLQYFFSWLEKVYISREYAEVRLNSGVYINYCVSSRLEVTLSLHSDGISRLLYEGGPANVSRCKAGPYLGEKASIVYSVAPIAAATASAPAQRPSPVLVTPADSEKGEAAYKRKDYATAFRELEPLAQQGDSKAQFYLAFMYDDGTGVPQDHREAAKWFRLAADQGVITAQFNLGVKYDLGEGVPQDQREATKWFRLAADQGNAAAQYNLGARYQVGKGVPKDKREAVKWFRLAADQGYASAQNNLGSMYELGDGVPQNRVVAYALYNVSALNESSRSSSAASNRRILAEKMLSSEVEAGKVLTREMIKPNNLLVALDRYIKK